MKNKRGWFLNFVLILLVLVVIAIGVYFLYMNLPGEPEDLNPVIIRPPIIQNQTFSEVRQFYPNMKFNHNSISYQINSDCDGEKKARMIDAFNNLASKVRIISFHEVADNADIDISCSENKKESIEEKHFVAGEGGAKEIIQTDRYNVINDGLIFLYQKANRNCDWANVELHELVHVFGFGHSENPDSLMYPILEDCDQDLDEEIIVELKRLYSEQNLADLYFDEVIAVKKGKYLDFNLTIKNSGSINSEKTKFSVLDDGELTEDFDLDIINYGAGIVIEIKNLKLNTRNPDEIRFVIDRADLVDEIDEENNVAVVSLN